MTTNIKYNIMNFLKSLLTVSFCSIALIGCKETASKANLPQETKEPKKEKTIAAKPETASFHIEGMTCAIGCAKTIEEKLADTDGIQEAKVDFDKKEATVVFDAAVLDSKKITDLVESCADGKTYKVSDMKTKI